MLKTAHGLRPGECRIALTGSEITLLKHAIRISRESRLVGMDTARALARVGNKLNDRIVVLTNVEWNSLHDLSHVARTHPDDFGAGQHTGAGRYFLTTLSRISNKLPPAGAGTY